MKAKKLNNEELENVNGGTIVINDNIQCDNCKQIFPIDTYTYYEGNSCSQKLYFTCPNCGNKQEV